jgi:hypothetical protein
MVVNVACRAYSFSVVRGKDLFVYVRVGLWLLEIKSLTEGGYE